MSNTWEGFARSDTDYTRIPNNFFEALALIDSLAELKIVLYIMRHTWGFQEYDIFKRITTDEFVYGRMLRTGERMDNGTGLSSGSVKQATAKAVDHGFLEVEIDYRDMARIKKSYRLKLRDTEEDTQAEQEQSQQPTAKRKSSRLEELRTMPYAEYLQTPEWAKKRAKALRFAQFKCQLCNEDSNLNVHHRSYERRGNEPLGDLIVLCQDCHTIFHQNKELA